MENKTFAKIIIRPLLFTLALLLIPFLGQWDWNEGDYAIASVLIFGTGLTYEFLTKNAKNTRRRIITGAVLLAVFLIVWIELAVGLFGSPFAGN